MNKIPQKIKQYLTSMKAVDLNGELCGKYGIDGRAISENTKMIHSIFYKEFPVSELPKKISQTFGFDAKKSKEMARDIIGMRLLIIKDWFADENLEEYVKKLGGNPVDYQKYIDEHKAAVIEEEKYFAEQMKEEDPYVAPLPKPDLPDEVAPEYDEQLEKDDSIAFFKKGIGVMLKNPGSNPVYEGYNTILLKIISEDDKFREALENSLYANDDLLTGVEIELDGRKQTPTIANWLKDYIKSKGSEYPENVAISDYLTNSVNAKKLDSKERETVGRLITLYRNVKYFPKGLSTNPEEWEIIPTVKEEVLTKARTVAKPKFEEKREAPKAPPANLPGMTVAPKADDDGAVKAVEEISQVVASTTETREQKIAELNEIAKKYQPGTLERKAVEEAVRRL